MTTAYLNGSNGVNGHAYSDKVSHSASHPCPICGGCDQDKRGTNTRCSGFTSGEWVHCSRDQYSGQAKFYEQSSTWAHWLQGPCPCGADHGTAFPARKHPSSRNKPPRTPKVYPTLKAAVDALASVVSENAGSPVAKRGHEVYDDVDGNPHMAVARYDFEDGEKSYRPFHPVGTGWSTGDPPGKLPLFRLPRLRTAKRVYVLEGEKCALIVESVGLIATTTAHGAKSANKSDVSPLAGIEVVVTRDNDPDGERYEADICRLLAKVEPRPIIKTLRLRLESKGDDIEQWIESRPETWTDEDCRRDLERLADEAPEWVPSLESSSPKNQNASTNGTDHSSQKPFPCTDRGNAERLVAQHGRDFRHCFPWRKYLLWDGCRWKVDETGEMYQRAKATARGILDEAAAAIDDEERKILAAWWRSSESKKSLDAMIALASSENGIPVLPEGLNGNSWLLNVRNGTIDLKTGRLQTHRRDDLITTLAPVKFDPDAKCPIWDATLHRCFGQKAEMVRFWQRLCGLALTGSVEEHILPILYGSGANGKSTILNVLLEMLGTDYALMAPPGILMVKRGDSHPTERACLYGMRLVVDVESAEGAKLNENLVKQLTGGDRIRARRMKEDFWEFAPTHKLMLCTNHKPAIQETKNAIWRRIKVIPFTVTIPEAEQIKDLASQLRSEYSGILAWCVRGCLDWQRDGLAVPTEVSDATAEYHAEQDVLAAFIADECTVNDQLSAKASQIYQRYQKWTEASGEKPVTQITFGTAMKDRGFERYTNNGTRYRGIGLRSDGRDESNACY